MSDNPETHKDTRQGVPPGETAEFSMLKMPDGTFFRCECGANVFTKISVNLYECNGCGAIYIADPSSEETVEVTAPADPTTPDTPEADNG